MQTSNKTTINKTLVKTALKTKGWKEIEKYLNKKIDEFNTIDGVEFNLDPEQLGVRCKARSDAVQLLREVLRELKDIELEEKPKQKIIYK